MGLYRLCGARLLLAGFGFNRQFGRVKPDGENKGKANKLRHLIEKIRIENKLRPSFVQSFALSTFPPRGRLYQRQNFRLTSIGSQRLATFPKGESKDNAGITKQAKPARWEGFE